MLPTASISAFVRLFFGGGALFPRHLFFDRFKRLLLGFGQCAQDVSEAGHADRGVQPEGSGCADLLVQDRESVGEDKTGSPE